MPHALLLSPDDQAVSAITGVLEEMSVTCERPLDGASAAQKLNSQSFDLVLVDCENLPAAKLIFDVCRRGKNGSNPVPIAIVDGRAGLPTAFRLGAELILTKPVAKDQARSTIRTAVSRVHKIVPTNESTHALESNAADTTEVRAQAAAAGVVSPQLTSFDEPAPTFFAATATAKMSAAVDEAEAPPSRTTLTPHSAPFSASSLSKSKPTSSESSSSDSPTGTAPVDSKPEDALSDDPVMVELERTELEESQKTELQLVESQKVDSQKQSSEVEKAAADKITAEPAAPVFSSYRQGPKKTRSPLVALLMLTLAGGGFYAAWTHQPGFRAIAQPQIDRVLALAGTALPPAPVPHPARPAAQPAPSKAPVPAPESPIDPNASQVTAPGSTTSSADVSNGPPAAATAPAPESTTPLLATKSEAGKPSQSTPDDSESGDNNKDAAAANSSSAPLPGESAAVILSSKGAEKRLAHSVAPKYPAAARSGQGEGTVVLKAVVDENGKVEGVRLVEGNATLAAAAIQAVKQWRYRPYVRDGKAQPFQTVVIVDFQRP
jgi:periplasmic protein TonB